MVLILIMFVLTFEEKLCDESRHDIDDKHFPENKDNGEQQDHYPRHRKISQRGRHEHPEHPCQCKEKHDENREQEKDADCANDIMVTIGRSSERIYSGSTP